jgi:hypothetical protein
VEKIKRNIKGKKKSNKNEHSKPQKYIEIAKPNMQACMPYILVFYTPKHAFKDVHMYPFIFV